MVRMPEPLRVVDPFEWYWCDLRHPVFGWMFEVIDYRARGMAFDTRHPANRTREQREAHLRAGGWSVTCDRSAGHRHVWRCPDHAVRDGPPAGSLPCWR